MDPIKRVSNWFFSKKVLPYWVILLADAAIVFGSAIFTFWIFTNSQITFDHHIEVFSTALLYAVLSWVGARLFKTYSGVLRYSSFVDLLKLTYANIVSLVLAIAAALIFKWQNVELLSAFTITQTLVSFLIATLLMWGLRVLVKILFDINNTNSQAERVLIYGAITGGVGLAKNIRSQSPARFELRGFISHEHRIKDMQLLGVKVYTLDDDIAKIIRDEHIQGILVSPLRTNEFRMN